MLAKAKCLPVKKNVFFCPDLTHMPFILKSNIGEGATHGTANSGIFRWNQETAGRLDLARKLVNGPKLLFDEQRDGRSPATSE